jgi:hypothetical protein
VTEIDVSPARFAVTSTSVIPSRIDEYGAVMVALGPAGPPPIETVPNSTETVTRISIPALASFTSPPMNAIEIGTGVPTINSEDPMLTTGALSPLLPPPPEPPVAEPPPDDEGFVEPGSFGVATPELGLAAGVGKGVGTGLGVFQFSPGGGSVQAGPPSPHGGFG